MKIVVKNTLIIFSVLVLFHSSINSQNIVSPKLSNPDTPPFQLIESKLEERKLEERKLKESFPHKTRGPLYDYVFITALVFLFSTPQLVYENKKIYFGIGRELSLLFGNAGRFRISAEYSFILRKELKHHFRAALKYDFLSDLDKSDWFDERDLFSIGAGYFLDTEGSGFFPEVTAGFRIGGDGNYFLYPYIKLRHTFMTKKVKPDITDLSIGMAIGYNPFR